MPRLPASPLSAVAVVALLLILTVDAARPTVAEAGGGCHMDNANGYTEGSATVVRMDVCSFEPTVVRVPVGTTVRFLNTAPNDHVVAGRRNTWGSNDTLVPGAEFGERFGEAGVYPFTCPLHTGMVGAVIVGDPLAAAAAAGSASEPAPGAASGTTPVAQADATQIAVGVGAGLLIGSIVGLLAGFVVARRPSTGSSHPAEQPRVRAIDG